MRTHDKFFKTITSVIQIRRLSECIRQHGGLNVSAALFITLFLLIDCGNCPCEAKKASVLGWQIEQNVEGWGPIRITASAEGALYCDVSRGFKIAMHPPDWRLLYYSDSRKVFADVPMSSLGRSVSNRVRVFVGGDSAEMDPSQWKLEGESRLDGIPVQLYTHVFQADSGAKGEHKWKCYVAKEIKLPAQVRTFMCQYYGIVDVGKIPLQFQTGEFSHSDLLRTTSIHKTVVDRVIFKAPSNYKKVTQEQVMFAVQDFPMQ